MDIYTCTNILAVQHEYTILNDAPWHGMNPFQWEKLMKVHEFLAKVNEIEAYHLRTQTWDGSNNYIISSCYTHPTCTNGLTYRIWQHYLSYMLGWQYQTIRFIDAIATQWSKDVRNRKLQYYHTKLNLACWDIYNEATICTQPCLPPPYHLMQEEISPTSTLVFLSFVPLCYAIHHFS